MNYLDTRDLYKRQCELQEELEALQDVVEEARELITEETEGDDPDGVWATLHEAEDDLADWQSEYQEDLDELNNLENEVGREWMHGTTLIPESEFTEYAQDLAEDISGMPKDQPWPFSHIDWEAAADALKQDYSEAEYQGTTYLFRAS